MKKRKQDETKLSEDEKILLWKRKVNEQDWLETMRERIEEAKKEAFEKGKLEGEVEAEISLIKTLIKFNISEEKIISDLKFLTQAKLIDKLQSNIEYIKTHINDSDSQICDELNLFGVLVEEDPI